MATRFYFPSSGTTAITPAVHTSWTVTAGAFARRPLIPSVPSGTTGETVNGTGNTATGGFQVVRQYIIGGLPGQTISGTLKGQVRISAQGGGSVLGKLAIAAAVAAADGSGRLNLLVPTGSTDTTVPPSITSASLTNRRFESGSNVFALTLTSQTVPANGVLIIEVGYIDTSTSASRFLQFAFSDNGTDLPEDETTATALNPWVEFSSTIQFQKTLALAPAAVAVAAQPIGVVSGLSGVGLLSSVKAGGFDGATSAAIDTTGATALVIGAACLNGETLTADSRGNTYTPLTVQVGDFSQVQLFYVLSPTVGASHTFTVDTVAGAGSYLAFVAAAFTGNATFDKQNGATALDAGTTTSLQPGSVTPAAATSLVVTVCSSLEEAFTSLTIDNGFASVDYVRPSGANSHYGVGLAYKIKTTASAENPTWGWASDSPAESRIAVFTLTAGPAGTHYTLATDAAAVAVSGQTLAVLRGRRAALDEAAAALDTQAVALSWGRPAALDAAAVALDAQAVGLLWGRKAGPTAAVVVSVQAVALLRGSALGLDAAAVALSGQAVTLNPGRTLTLDGAAVAVDVQAVALLRGRALALDAASVALAGQAVGLLRGRALGLDATALAVSVPALTLTKLAVSALALDAAAVVLEVPALGLRRTATVLTLDAAAVTVSAPALSLRRTATVLTLDAAAVAIDVQALTLLQLAVSTIGLSSTTVALDVPALTLRRTVTGALAPAAVSVSAQAVTLLRGRALALTAATVTVSGPALTLRRTVTVVLEAAALAVSPQALGGLRGRALALAPAAVTVSAPALSLRRTATVLTLDAATVALSAQALALSRQVHRALALAPAALAVVPADLGVRWGAGLALAPAAVALEAHALTVTHLELVHYGLALDLAGVTVTVGPLTVWYSGQVLGIIEIPGSYAPVIVMRGSDAHVVAMRGANDRVVGVTGAHDPVVDLRGADDRVLVLTGATE